MSLEQASYLSQVIGALAVIASLIFVGFQVRQNTRAQRVVAVNSLAAAAVAINVPAMESPAFGEALATALKDWKAASRDQRIIAHYFLFSLFKLLENAWYQQKAGILDQAHWLGWESLLRKYYHSEGVRQVWWPSRRHAYSPEFQNFLAKTKPLEEIASLGKIFD